MMFGTRDEFAYLECGECGCLQIGEIPDDLSKYYPADYYAYQPARNPNPRTSLNRVRAALARKGLSRRHQVARYYLRPGYLPGRLLERTYSPDARAAVVPKWLVPRGVDLGLRFGSRLLDIGCGNGATLLQLHAIGFTDLWGADPFVPGDSRPAPGVTILRSTAGSLSGGFDFIMMHHSFEHVPDPAETLRAVGRLLEPGAYALIRTPVADCLAWKRYGVDWVQLDAPRHLHVYTRGGIERLAEQAGLALAHVAYDSTGFQFWGSEQYRQNIPLMSAQSFATGPEHAVFTRAEVDRLDADAEALNRSGRGDQACFYLRRRG